RRAKVGKRVLFVCFNRALREHLNKREQGSGVDFFTFHGICRRLAGIAGVEIPEYAAGEAPQEFFDTELPAALIEAVDELGPQYDAIFVDEAQDLSNDWLDALTATLADPANDLVWLFLDDNQRVYEQRLDIPREFMRFDLTVN